MKILSFRVVFSTILVIFIILAEAEENLFLDDTEEDGDDKKRNVNTVSRFGNRFRSRRFRVRRQSALNHQKPISLLTEEEFRTEVIVPVMNIMGLGLSVFGNLYPVRQLLNDDGTPMNTTELKLFRTQMNTFHSRFVELGHHLTGVVDHSRGLRDPFQVLGKKISLSRQMQGKKFRTSIQSRRP